MNGKIYMEARVRLESLPRLGTSAIDECEILKNIGSPVMCSFLHRPPGSRARLMGAIKRLVAGAVDKARLAYKFIRQSVIGCDRERTNRC